MKTNFKQSILTKSIVASALVAMASVSQAVEFEVSITNTTGGTFFTPLLVSAHSDDLSMFTVGETASMQLQAIAEGGDISGLSAVLSGAGATVVENPAGGLLAAGESTTVMLNTNNTPDNAYLSISAMVLPTNDGFVGLRNWKIPTEAGTYTVDLVAYDAGTEANDEILGGGASGVAGFPAPPPVAAVTGVNGTGVTATAEGFVHVHRGVLGDSDLSGGVSDIDYSQRWLNPVARAVITVK